MRRLCYKYRVRKWWSLKFYEADYFKQPGMIKSLTCGCEHHVSLIVIVFFPKVTRIYSYFSLYFSSTFILLNPLKEIQEHLLY